MRLIPVFSVLLLLSGCLGMPEGVEPVRSFELSRYLGTWHEIARLDHSFERGLTEVTATYSMNEDGSVKVVNRGFDAEDKEWKEAVGRAKFVESPDVAHLKVSFFGPFYGSYVVFGLDETDYGYAFVSGFSDSYLWLLAREPTVPAEVREAFLAQARDAGFDTEELIWLSAN